MKKITLSMLGALALSSVTAQNNTNPFPTSGNVGIGTGASQSSAVFNLQLHGTTDYTVYVPGSPAGLNNQPPATSGYYQPMGKTARLGLTNTVTGATVSDGGQLRMSENNLVLENLEKRNLTLSTDKTSIALSGASNTIAIASYGITFRQQQTGLPGISLQMAGDTDNAIQVTNVSGSVRNFSVQSNGMVFARKYTTTLANIPDYVFDPAYKLLSFEELRVYLELNRHLPNVPSATDYQKTGVDLGEMNRILLEKTEELTLYILQLEERLQKLEEKK